MRNLKGTLLSQSKRWLCDFNKTGRKNEENLAGKLGGNIGNEGGCKLDTHDGDGVPSL